MKQATFYLEKIIKDGKEYVKVLGWENILEYPKLPEEYLSAIPCFFYSGKGKGIIIHYKNHLVNIYKGNYIEREHWEELKKYMKQAGERLSRIGQIQKWHGKFKVEI